jgi:hypothetical protein
LWLDAFPAACLHLFDTADLHEAKALLEMLS